MPISQAKASD